MISTAPQRFLLIGLLIQKNTAPRLKKNLSGNGWYPFNTWYSCSPDKPGRLPERRSGLEHVHRLYGSNITVQAIVGKNGSGKSSVMELVYRMANNLSCLLRIRHAKTSTAESLHFIPGIHARLYFEAQGKVGYLKCRDRRVELHWGEEKVLSGGYKEEGCYLDEDENKDLSQVGEAFCYILVSNYAMMALAPDDYADESEPKGSLWLNSLYYKNDGYLACIGFEPFKGDNHIDLVKQKDLCRTRLTALFIENRYAQKTKPLFDSYTLERIDLKFSTEKIEHMLCTGNPASEPTLPDIVEGIKEPKSVAHAIMKCYDFSALRDTLSSTHPEEIEAAAVYLVLKTLDIARTYPKYSEFQFGESIAQSALSTEEKEAGIAEHLCKALKEDTSHITLKIRQTRHFLQKARKKGRELPSLETYQAYADAFALKHTSLSEILDHYPPPIFTDALILQPSATSSPKEKSLVPFERISSGERQLMQTTASMLYHMRNIASMSPQPGLPHYRHITLFLDEIEVCFHPDYQRKFIELFLRLIKNQELDKSLSLNIVFATHSPFILSDLPRENILYLKEGEAISPQRLINPFCANINEILRQSFFLEEGFMGEFAKKKVLEVLEDKGEEQHEQFVEMIGDPLMRRHLREVCYARRKKETQPEELIKWHKTELARLKKKTE